MIDLTSRHSLHSLALVSALVFAACSGEGDATTVEEESDDVRVIHFGGGDWIADADAGAGGAGPATDAGKAGEPSCQTETTVVWFPDADGDGWGVTAGGVRACDKPPGQWSRAGGDCADHEPRANPAQRIYFPEPYVTADGQPTFDYDCNDYEDSDPRQPGGAPQCGVLSISECGGSGYLPGPRYGEGVNALCGSRSTIACAPNTLGLLCGPVHAMVDEALRCH